MNNLKLSVKFEYMRFWTREVVFSSPSFMDTVRAPPSDC